VRTIDETQLLVAIRQFELDGIPATIESLAEYLHWDESRLRTALAASVHERTVYVIGPFLHVERSE